MYVDVDVDGVVSVCSSTIQLLSSQRYVWKCEPAASSAGPIPTFSMLNYEKQEGRLCEISCMICLWCNKIREKVTSSTDCSEIKYTFTIHLLLTWEPKRSKHILWIHLSSSIISLPITGCELEYFELQWPLADLSVFMWSLLGYGMHHIHVSGSPTS